MENKIDLIMMTVVCIFISYENWYYSNRVRKDLKYTKDRIDSLVEYIHDINTQQEKFNNNQHTLNNATTAILNDLQKVVRTECVKIQKG